MHVALLPAPRGEPNAGTVAPALSQQLLDVSSILGELQPCHCSLHNGAPLQRGGVVDIILGVFPEQQHRMSQYLCTRPSNVLL